MNIIYSKTSPTSSMKMQNFRLLQIVCLLFLTGVYSLKAANGNDTWNGSGGDNNWGTAGNWTAGSANKPPIAGDALFFDGLLQLNANNNFSAPANTFNGLNFNVTAGAFTLTGNQITNTAAIIDNSPNLETINLSLVFPALQSITVTSNNASLLIGGVISGAGGVNVDGPGTVTLTNNNTYTGGTTNNAGILKLDFSGAAGNNIISSNSALALGGGTLNVVGRSGVTNSQTFSGLALKAGANTITVNKNGATNVTVALGAITPVPAGLGALGSIVFNGPATINAAGANVVSNGSITTTTAGLTPSGVLASAIRQNAYATVGLYDWASTDLPSGAAGTSPFTIVGGSQVANFYVVPTNGVAAFPSSSSTNYDIAMPQIPGDRTNQPSFNGGNAVTFRFNTPKAPYVWTAGPASLNPANVQVGGVLITPNMGPVNAAIDSIRTIAAGLQIFQNNVAGVFIIGAVNDSNGGASLVKSGPGTLFINPIIGNEIAMNYVDTNGVFITVTNSSGISTNYDYPLLTTLGGKWFGPLSLNGGVTVINNNNNLGYPNPQLTGAGVQGTLNLNGGTLMTDLNDVSLFNTVAGANRPVYLGAYGGGLAAASNTTMTVAGLVANSVPTSGGPLTIGIAASSANGNTLGLVPGMGGTNGNPALIANGTVALSGPNTYSGGTILQSGTLQISGINNLGGAGTYGGITINNGSTLQYASLPTGAGSLDISSGRGITLATDGKIDVNGNSVTYANSIGNGGSGSLIALSSVASTNAILTLQGAGTYKGTTTITNVTLLVNNASGSATGTNQVIVQNGGTLGGSGTISGSVTIQSGGQTLPGTGVTNIIGGNLTYLSGAGANFNLTPSATNGNDQIVINGASSVLTCGGVSVGINCGLVLDQTQDYVLFKLTGGSASISGSFNATPVWLGVTPIGAAKYSVIISGNQVLLHNSMPTPPPTITATSANPNPVLDFQTLTISASVTPGSGAIDPNTGVTVDLTPIGSSVQPLIYDGAGHYTNSFVVSVTAVPGNFTLNVVAQDSLGGAAIGYISLTVGNSATWNGADFGSSGNWSDGLNWVSGFPPGYGDDVVFAGGAGLAPVLDSSYNVASVTFSNNAGSFNLVNSGGSVLTIANGVTNNSANVQVFNLPVMDNGLLPLNAASNNLVFNDVVSGSGGLIAAGPNTTKLLGANTYTGSSSIRSGASLVISDLGQLGADNGGNYLGTITNNGTLTYTSSIPQTLSGRLYGNGALNLTGPSQLTLAANNNPALTAYTGPIVIDGSGSALFLAGNNVTVGEAASGTGLVTLTNGGSLYMNGYNSTTTNYIPMVNPILVPAGSIGNLFTMGAGAYNGNVTVNGTLNVFEFYHFAGAGGSWSNSDGLINIVNDNFYLSIGGNFSFGTAAVNLGPGVFIINAGNTSVGGNTITIGELTGTGVITDNTGGAAGRPCIYIVGGRNSNATFAGTIQDNLRGTGINKVGTGSWTLTGSDTYTQPTTISAGSLIVGPSSFMMNCTNITVAAGALFDVSSYGGLTLSATNNLGGSGVVTGAVTAVANNVINAGVGSTAGTLSFSNSFAESGPYVTNNFNLSSDPTGVSKTNSQIIVSGDLSLFGTNVVAINPVNGLLGAGTYTLFKYSGNLNNEGGVVPAGTLLPNNLIAGGAFANGSDVILTFSNALHAIVMIVQPNGKNITWKGGFTATVTNITATVTNPAVFVTNIVASVTNNWDVNVSSNWLNAGVVKNFFNYDNVTFNDSSTNLNVIVAGTVAPGSITVNTTNSYTFSGTGKISGPTGLTKSGTNVLTISNSGSNDYSGLVTITAGSLRVGVATALGGTNGSTIITNTGVLDIAGFNLGAEPVIVSGAGSGNGAILNNGAAQQNALQFVTLAGNTTFGGTNRWDIRSDTNGVGSLVGSGYTLTKTSTNDIYLAGLGNTALGDIQIRQGRLGILGTTLLGTGNTLTLFAGAGLDFSTSTVTNTKALSLTNATLSSSVGSNVYGGAINLNGIGTITATTPLVLQGAISGTGGLLKNGASLLTLAGTNVYTGSTILSNGVVALVGTASIAGSTNIDLAIAGAQLDVSSLTGGIFNLASGQTLKGIGSIKGGLTTASGSTVAPGESAPGTLTISNTATLGGNIVMLVTNGNISSKLVAASIIYGGTLTVTNLGGALTNGNTFQLFTGSFGGSFAVTNLPALTSGLGWSNSLALNGRLMVVVTVNPNPTNITLSVNGNVLTLAWPSDHTGWHLQIQTNSLSNGLGTNWVTLPGSESVNTTNFTINPANSTVFYRLVYP